VFSGEAYQFDLRSTGGTVWTLRVNGALLGGTLNRSTFDFGASTATWAGGIGFSEVALYSNSTDVPPVATATLAFAFHQSSGWYLPTGARIVFPGGGMSPWGVEGRAQHPTLAPDEVRSGTTIAAVPNGTVLWTGGAVPVRVGLSLSSAVTVATLPVGASIEVRDLSGLPIPDVPVELADALEGPLVPAPVLTGSNGSITLEFLAPNVSVVSHDLVSATVVIPGYLGTTGIGLELTPAAELSLSYSGVPPTVAPNDTISLAFRATDAATGAPSPGVLVGFSAGYGGALLAGYAPTGPDGTVTVDFLAGPTQAQVLVDASVIEPGFWGHAEVTVDIVRPTPTLLDRAQLWIALGVVLAVIAVPAILLLSRWRHRPPIPELRLGGAASAGPARGPAGDAAAGTDRSPANRTRP
jgi:hypothetical protein